jgi:hypothetical protein
MLFNVPIILVAIKKTIFSSFDQYIAQLKFKFSNEIKGVLLLVLSWFARSVQFNLTWCFFDWFGSVASLSSSSHTICMKYVVFVRFVLLLFISCMYDLLFSGAITKYIFSPFLSNLYIYVVMLNIIIMFMIHLIIIVSVIVQLVVLVLLNVYRHTDAIKNLYTARCCYTFCFPRSFLPIRLMLSVRF